MQRKRQTRLGTGVVSVGCHNPLWVAERIVQLDPPTRGRAMPGVGPAFAPPPGQPRGGKRLALAVAWPEAMAARALSLAEAVGRLTN